MRVVQRPLTSEMVTHHHARAVGVNGADIGKRRGLDEEGRAVTWFGENGEIRTNFTAHHQEALVSTFHVQFCPSGEVEFRHIKGNGRLGAKANRRLEHVVVARAFRLSIDIRVGGTSRRLSLRSEGVSEVGGHVRHGTESLRQQRIHRIVDRSHQLLAHGVGTRPCGLFSEETADQIGWRPVVLFKTVKFQRISKNALVETKR